MKRLNRAISVIGGLALLYSAYRFALQPEDVQPYEIFLMGPLVLLPLAMGLILRVVIDVLEEDEQRQMEDEQRQMEDVLWLDALPLDMEATRVDG